MDWSNERYVRWYTRDTKTWMLLGWQGQAVLGFLMRKVDRAGTLNDVSDGADLAVIFSNGMPIEHIQQGLDRLIQKDVVRLTDSGLVIVNFLAAQEASKSDALRQKESRDRRRAGFLKQPLTRAGQVYFIQSENGGPIKIGFASDVKSRMSNIQTGRADKIVLLASIDGTPEMESELHSRFAEHAIGGEWFAPCEELMKMIGVTCDGKTVTARDAVETARDHLSQSVTVGHASSQPVTLNLAVPCSALPCHAEKEEISGRADNLEDAGQAIVPDAQRLASAAYSTPVRHTMATHAAPTPQETRSKASSTDLPNRRDPMRDQLNGTLPGQRPEVVQVHELWKSTFGKTGAQLGNPNGQLATLIRDAVRDYGLADCLAVVRQAPLDGMVTGKDDERGKRHDDLFYILSQRTFDRLLVASKKPQATKRREPTAGELKQMGRG